VRDGSQPERSCGLTEQLAGDVSCGVRFLVWPGRVGARTRRRGGADKRKPQAPCRPDRSLALPAWASRHHERALKREALFYRPRDGGGGSSGVRVLGWFGRGVVYLSNQGRHFSGAFWILVWAVRPRRPCSPAKLISRRRRSFAGGSHGRQHGDVRGPQVAIFYFA
jgi:hypothetical protein